MSESSSYRSAALSNGDGPTGGQNARTTELKTTASIVSAHSENVDNNRKPHTTNQAVGKGKLGVRGHREG